MTINEYVKKEHLPEMRLLGELKNFRYYIKKNIPEDSAEGPPMVILENKKNNTFEVCDIMQGLKAIGLFEEK